eukprot:1083425-Rhodomonas_salina.1
MRTDAHGVPTQVPADCELLSLTPALLGHLWPAERGVSGQRVCKQLRKDLMAHCNSIALVQKTDTMPSESSVSEDFARLPQDLMVLLTLKRQFGSGATSLLGVLNECKALA